MISIRISTRIRRGNKKTELTLNWNPDCRYQYTDWILTDLPPIILLNLNCLCRLIRQHVRKGGGPNQASGRIGGWSAEKRGVGRRDLNKLTEEKLYRPLLAVITGGGEK